jgi:hypothetical protein
MACMFVSCYHVVTNIFRVILYIQNFIFNLTLLSDLYLMYNNPDINKSPNSMIVAPPKLDVVH